jgi:hypothetical protein
MSTQTLPVIKKFIDRELLAEIETSCDLWVQAASNRITLLAADADKSRIVGLTVLEFADNSLFQKGLFELRSFLDGQELFGRDYRNIHIVFETPQFTIVPDVLFDQESAPMVLQNLHELPKFYAVKSNRVDSRHWVNVYGVPDIFCSTLKVLFPHADIRHYAEFLLESFLLQNQRGHETLFVNIHDSFMDVVFFHLNELRFVNTFTFEAETDIIYFILSVAEQQKISTDKLEIILSGDVNANGPLLQLLRKYVPGVELFKRPGGISYPASFREFQDQQYYTSLSVLLCES